MSEYINTPAEYSSNTPTETTTQNPVAWSPPPPPPAKKKITPAFVIVAVIALLGVLGTIFLVTMKDSAPPAPKEIQVFYSITLNDAYCDHEFDTFDGYQDITEGTEVELFDGSGNLLGFGDLGPCQASTTYNAIFTAKVSTDGAYRITLGNNNRGYLNYTEADVIDGILYSEASLG